MKSFASPGVLVGTFTLNVIFASAASTKPDESRMINNASRDLKHDVIMRVRLLRARARVKVILRARLRSLTSAPLGRSLIPFPFPPPIRYRARVRHRGVRLVGQ